MNFKSYIKNILLALLLINLCIKGTAQDNVYPAPENKGKFVIKNATIHIGNGEVLTNSSLLVDGKKIAQVGSSVVETGATVYDAAGKHVYPGLILSRTQFGLREIGSGTRGSNDFNEIGTMNAGIRAENAYNADSKILNVMRSNGVLLANVVPVSALVAGRSSVMQLDAWNWKDAIYHSGSGMHVYLPSLLQRPPREGFPDNRVEQRRVAQERIEEVKKYFRDAKAYLSTSKNQVTNLNLAAAKDLFDKKEKLFVHCNIVKEMLVAVDIAREFGFDVVIVGGSESFQIAPLLKQYNIAVILSQTWSLPTLEDDDVDQPFKTPAVLQKAGVLFSINDDAGNTTARNLPFNAGMAAGYGLTKEEALQSVTLSPAKILGIDKRTGSLEVGKDANLLIVSGDLLDMKSSVVENAFIEGRKLDLTDKHKQMNDRYNKRYGITK